MSFTEKIAKIEEEEIKALAESKPAPSKVVYPVRSGSKDIKAQWIIGGKYARQEKEKKARKARNPTPIFGKGAKSFEDKEVATSTKEEVIKIPGLTNISCVPKITNTDMRDTLPAKDKVFGLARMGGKGTWSASGAEKKIEELKLLKGLLKPLGFEQKPKKGGLW